MDELYISIDVETNGPIPGPNSMLSLGAVAFLADRTEVGTFEAVLEELEGSAGDPDTMAWWATQPPEIWAACRKDPVAPREAMDLYVKWIYGLTKEYNLKPVCVAYPAGFDFTYVHWYLHKFLNRDPCGFSCIDIKSYAMAKLGQNFRNTTKKTMPSSWFAGLPPHTHRAVDDAREQGLLFLNMLNG